MEENVPTINFPIFIPAIVKKIILATTVSRVSISWNKFIRAGSKYCVVNFDFVSPKLTSRFNLPDGRFPQ